MRLVARLATTIAIAFGAVSVSCSPVPATSTVATEVARQAPSAAPTSPAEPAPQAPLLLASVKIAAGDLVVTPTHIYWLETRVPAPKPRSGSAGAARAFLGLGVALMCDEARGALMRVDRKTHEKAAVAELDYRPFSLAYDGRRLYWTGAPCTGRAAMAGDPEWLWTWDPATGGAPATLGERDRNYLDIVTAAGAAFVSDRFGKGGAFRFVDGGKPELVVSEKEQPWVVAADARSFFWSDAAWTLWETDVGTGRATKHVALGAMPTDAHLFEGGLVVRTTSEVLVLRRPGMTEAKRLRIPSYGDRGRGALARGRHYLWADGTSRINRLDLETGAIASAVTSEAEEACGVAYDEGTVFWIDRKRNGIFAWPSPPFVSEP